MRLIYSVIFLGAFSLVYGAPQHLEKDALIIRHESENIGTDGYNFAYETTNGIIHQESGKLKNIGTENEAMVVQGSYTYTGPDGVVYSVTYIADENGFRPQGVHLSTNTKINRNNFIKPSVTGRFEIPKFDVRFNS